jgi:endonuclease YncB( thermonuclease family)
MFARRKNQEGFEWHRYVRTAVKHRRELRRQRVLQARHAAASQVGVAGKALLAGSCAAGAAARDGARAGFWATGLLVQGLWHFAVTVAVAAAQALAVLAQPVFAALARPHIGTPVALLGAISLGCGVGRYRATGPDGEAVLTLSIGVALLLMALPMLSGMTGLSLPRLRALGAAARITAVVAVAVVAALVAAAFVWRSGVTLAGLGSHLPLAGSSSSAKGSWSVKGRGEAVGGDRLRVGKTVVRLAGIEAPDRQQRCGAAGRGWRCGAAAQAALGRLVEGRVISCTVSGSDGAGSTLATCYSGETDVGAQMVKQGHAFAESGLFATYSGLEREARNAGVGIWSGGTVERPAEYRARIGKSSRAGRPKEPGSRGT